MTRPNNIPGAAFTLQDVADAVKEGVDLYAGLNSGDLADENTKVEAEVVVQRERPVVLVQIGVHLYALPVYRLTRRTDLDLDVFLQGGG